MSEWERGEIAADAQNENLINNGYVKSVMSQRRRWVSLLNRRMSEVVLSLSLSASPSLLSFSECCRRETDWWCRGSDGGEKRKKTERKTSF